MNLRSQRFLFVLVTSVLSLAGPSYASVQCSSVFDNGEYTEAKEQDAIRGLARMKIDIDEALAYRDTMSPGMIKKMQQTYEKKMKDFLALSKMDEATFKAKITASIQLAQEKEISVDEKIILEQKKLLGEIVSYTAMAPIATGIPFSFNLRMFEYLPEAKQALILERKNLYLIDITTGQHTTTMSDVVSVKIFADRKHALILTRDNKLIIMNLRNQSVLKEFTTTVSLIDGAVMDINPSQNQALIMALYGKAFTLDLQTGEEKPLTLPSRLQYISWSKAGAYINDNSIFFASNTVVAKLDLKTGESFEKNVLPSEHQDFVISNDGLEFLIYSSSSVVSINEKFEMTSEVKSYKDPHMMSQWEIREVKKIPQSPDHISMRIFNRKTGESKFVKDLSRSGFKFISPIPADTPNEKLSFADTGDGLMSLELDANKQYILRLWK